MKWQLLMGWLERRPEATSVAWALEVIIVRVSAEVCFSRRSHLLIIPVRTEAPLNGGHLPSRLHSRRRRCIGHPKLT